MNNNEYDHDMPAMMRAPDDADVAAGRYLAPARWSAAAAACARFEMSITVHCERVTCERRERAAQREARI